VGELGHGWVLTPALGETLETFSSHVQQLREAMQAAERDPAQLEVAAMPLRSGQTVAETLECVPDMLQAGVNVFRFGTARCRSVEEMFSFIDELSDAFKPYRQVQLQ
jgi:alkanesulfonate monooxygenase SsuD/methylene tetrahydromethanopterin reductase-like flavin-dependent oxidoreductase (luciferase family)